MSFGISIGDFVTLGATAWTLYRSVKDGPQELKEAQHELLALHIALRELGEDANENKSEDKVATDLAILVSGCKAALAELEVIVVKYTRLYNEKAFGRRIRLMGMNVQSIREKLAMHTNTINMYISTLGK